MLHSLWLVLAACTCASGNLLPDAAKTDTASQTELNLGPVFDIEDLSNPFEQLGRSGCLPTDFDVGNGTVEAIKACSRSVEGLEPPRRDKPRMGYYYQCMRQRLNVLTPSGFDTSGFVSLVTGFSANVSWRARAGQLALRCIAASDPTKGSGLSAQRQAVAVLACWKWSLALDCDLRDSTRDVHWGARCRRARFLAGACSRSPGALLKALTDRPDTQADTQTDSQSDGQADGQTGGQSNTRWLSCLTSMQNAPGTPELLTAVAADDLSEERCLTTESLAEEFVYCLMSEFTAPASDGSLTVDLEGLKSAAVARSGDMDDALALLAVVDGCQYAQDLQEFVRCWTETQILTCATDQASWLGHSY